MTPLPTPRAHRSGDPLRFIAPSGPIDQNHFDRGLAVIRHALPGSPLHAPETVRARSGYFAGSDAERLESLRAGLADPEARVLWCARGGYGLTRLLHRLDPSILREGPKLIVGFSDITALLAWALEAAGLSSLHGPVASQLTELDEDSRSRVFDMIRGELPVPLIAEEGTTLCGGRVEGPLIIGNLEVLRSLVGTPFMPSLQGRILAIEEVGERPYRIDRALTQLIQSGALRGVRGIAVGQLTRCDDPDNAKYKGPQAREVVVERLEGLGVPVVTGFEFGHERRRNVALPFGRMARLDADNACLECLEPAAT